MVKFSSGTFFFKFTLSICYILEGVDRFFRVLKILLALGKKFEIYQIGSANIEMIFWQFDFI